MIPASEQIAASRRALRHGSAKDGAGKDGRLTARVLIALAVVLTALGSVTESRSTS